MHQRLNFSKTLDYVRNLEVGNHGIFFYKSSHEKHEVLFNFLQAGFQKGEGAFTLQRKKLPSKSVDTWKISD
jgi:hypothetical protein